jgi:prepilin-type N-terminal cleavage/methylation domain-containing protein
MKSGFALIEVLIAAVLASMLSAALFFAWGQVQQVVVKADNTMSIFDRFMLVQRQFEQDFMGICVPTSRPYMKPTEDEKKKEEAPAAAKPDEKSEQKKEKPKRVESVFYAQNQGNNVELLTFLTNNPMEVYWSDRAGKACPRIARVQYTLKKDESKTDKVLSYTLYRQEANTLDYDQFSTDNEKAVRSYELIKGIKELKLTYWQEVQVEQENKEKKEGEKEKTEIKKDVKQVVNWDLEKEVPPKNTFIRPIPIMIKVELSLWDLQKKKSRSFTFMIPVPIDIENPAEKKSQEPAQPAAKPEAKPEAQKPAQAPSMMPKLPRAPGAGVNIPVKTDLVITKVEQGKLLKNLLNEKGPSEKKA